MERETEPLSPRAVPPGGLRKIRWDTGGEGKRGGVREFCLIVGATFRQTLREFCVIQFWTVLEGA